MSQERWDVVLKVLSGPLSGLGEQVLRGPVVRIGVNPGPGGLQLTGYRGLDARHAVITAYDGGTATIAPVGTNQVRLAPHAHVNWKEIDPINSPQYLNEMGAVHLGPVGRGATFEFVRCQRLGVWTQGGLASEADSVQSAAAGPKVGFVPQQPPASYDARKVGSISTSRAPFWFLGCLVTMFMTFSAVVSAVAIIYVVDGTVTDLGPVEEGEYWRDYARVDKAKLEEFGLLDGLEQPFAAFVMKYNADASGRRELLQPDNWDREFYDRVAASVYQHVQWRKVFRRFEQIKDDYHYVAQQMAQAGLPEAFAGIPYRESNYEADIQSYACAKGWWQFMPELAWRLENKEGMDFVVRNCRFSDAPDAVWNPDGPTPPPNVFANAKYIDHTTRQCRISKCEIDDRTSLEKSTTAAAFYLKEAWDDETLRGSGALVQLVIASHNAGYADGRFGKQFYKSSNIKPAYVGWSQKQPESMHASFYGKNITCEGEGEGISYCGGGPLHAQTQHYVYPIIARHILAVCYYAKNHSDMPGFANWVRYNEGDGYCTKFNIPDSRELK